MDLGKLKLRLGSTYQGDADAALQDIFSSFGNLNRELARMPGVGAIEASATITAGQAVNINSGLLRPADASLSRPAIGIALTGAAIGFKCTVLLGMGYVSGLTGLTLNSSIYLGNAGAFVYAIPGVGMRQSLGFSLSATEMFATISQPF